VTHEATDDDVEHTPDRCADVLAARCKALEAERDALQGWLSILFRAPSDHSKLVRVLVPKAFRGEVPNIERVLVEADLIRIGGRVPQTGSGYRPAESGAHSGSSPASSGSDSIGALTRRVAELEEALRWYANEEAWCDGYNASRERCDHPHDNVCGGPPHQPDILIDGGALARKALAASQAPRKDGET
jgi:hypothetical protein